MKTPTRVRPAKSAENIAVVAESVTENPGVPISRPSQELGLSPTTLHRILHKNLGLHAYKVHLTQELKPADHAQRCTSTDWVLEMNEQDHDFLLKIILSDEVHFHLSGYVNKQNCRIWGSENPREIVEQPLHPQRVTVWCGFWASGVIGPYFLQNDAGATASVNGLRYRTMFTDLFCLKLMVWK